MASGAWLTRLNRDGDPKLGARLRELRLERDLKQNMAAWLAGCGPRTLQRIEAGKRAPSRKLLEELVHTYQADPAEFGFPPRRVIYEFDELEEIEPELPQSPDEPERMRAEARLKAQQERETEAFVKRQKEAQELGRRIAAENWNLAYERHRKQARIEAGLEPGPIVFGNAGPFSFGAYLRRIHGE